MVTTAKKVTVVCLDCDYDIKLDAQPVKGQIINCPNCGTELEIIEVSPLEVDFYYEDDWDDEDWDDDDDDDDDWDDN